MMAWLLDGGGVALLALAILSAETVLLVRPAFRSGRKAGSGYVATSLSGIFLILAVYRVAVAGLDAAVLVLLTLAFVSHLTDLWARFR